MVSTLPYNSKVRGLILGLSRYSGHMGSSPAASVFVPWFNAWHINVFLLRVTGMLEVTQADNSTCQLYLFNLMELITSLLLTRLPKACDYVTVLDNIHDNHLWLKNTMMHTDANECFSSLVHE